MTVSFGHGTLTCTECVCASPYTGAYGVAVDVGAGIAGDGPITSDTLHVPEVFECSADGVGAGRYRVTVGAGLGVEFPTTAGESEWEFPA